MQDLQHALNIYDGAHASGLVDSFVKYLYTRFVFFVFK